jgi:hypothetical protein
MSSKNKKALRVLRSVEEELSNHQAKYNKILAEYDTEFDSSTFNRKYLYLKKENKELRDELKRFNAIITNLLESRNTSTLPL